MDEDRDLREFSGVCRLFPLPRVVLFPHNVLPLHIFEPRYRQMTEDALAGDRLVTIVQLVPLGQVRGLGSPAIEEVACLGKIHQYHRLPDGRFNFLLVGRKRVRLRREVPSDKLYRLAEVDMIEDESDGRPEEPRRSDLLDLFRDVFQRRHPMDPDLAALLATPLPLGVLTDIVAHALGFPPEVKQALLAEPCADLRADRLLDLLAEIACSDPPSRFPPPFSAN
jgi:Lon protease-like protein